MMCGKRLNRSGFTLIEIIITVVVVAVFGSMVLTFLSKSLVDTRDPVRRLRQASDINKIMADITADYNGYPKWRSGASYLVGNFIVPTIRNGHYYKCTSCGVTCISGSSEPDWPLNSGATKTDGTIIWTETAENGSLMSLTSLQSNINNKNYGTYDVVQNTFVQFPVGSDAETAGGSNILKVTLRNTEGETLTALFVSN